MNNQEYKKQLINRAFVFARQVIALVDKLPQKRSAWVIADQLIRSATSVGANIIEAQAGSSRKDFVNFLNHALKSANETKFWLALSKDVAPGKNAEIEVLLTEIDELAKILGSSIYRLKERS